MLKNIIKITYRNIKRNFGFSAINILGLSIGLAVSILGLLYVFNEMSYDRFHENSDRIHRITVNSLLGTAEIHQVYTPAAYTQALYDDFPEIEKITRIYTRNFEFECNGRKFIEKGVFAVDSSFFDIYTIPVIHGEGTSILNQPYCAVLTKSTAKKFFGNQDAINQTIHDGTNNYRVIAIVDDMPKNSHFHFNIALSLVSFDGYYNNPSWFESSFRTYVMFRKNADYRKVEASLPDFINKHAFNGNYDDFVQNGSSWEISFQKLSSIHLNSNRFGEFEVNGKKDYVTLFLVLSIFILIIACINFINLSTTKAKNRAKEIGIRKVLGSKKSEIIRQFLGESVLLSFVALIIAILLVEIILIFLPAQIGIEMQLPYFSNIYFIPALLVLGIIVGTASGIYPAMILSALRPVVVLKGKQSGNNKSNWFRNFLVIFQFLIASVLIIGVFVISNQTNLLLKGDLGFNKNKVIVINNANFVETSKKSINDEIRTLPFVQEVAHSSHLPGMQFSNWVGRVEGTDDNFSIDIFFSDENLKNVLELDMSEGRYFSQEYGTDSLAIILNEEAVRVIGIKDILGKRITFNGRLFLHVIGIVKNFQYDTKLRKIFPMAIFHMKHPENRTRFISIRIKSDENSKMISTLTRIWDKHSPNMPFDYTFLSTRYASMYKTEIYMKKLFVSFSFLSIFIACLGLLGLISFITQQRTKEIGVRRTFGASKSSIFLLLTKGLIKWIVIANLIAWPLAWYFFNNWLNKFAYRSNISWWYFLIAGMISFLIATLSVSYLTIKVVNTNPIKVLKCE